MGRRNNNATTATETPTRRSHQRIVMLDDDQQKVSAGDTVRFNYGIPPVCVKAKLVQRGNQLIALTPGHKPAECNFRYLRKYVGGLFKHNDRTELRLPESAATTTPKP